MLSVPQLGKHLLYSAALLLTHDGSHRHLACQSLAAASITLLAAFCCSCCPCLARLCIFLLHTTKNRLCQASLLLSLIRSCTDAMYLVSALQNIHSSTDCHHRQHHAFDNKLCLQALASREHRKMHCHSVSHQQEIKVVTATAGHMAC